jgi:hypothetical protein
MDSQKSFDERKHQINTYLKDIMSTDSDELFLALQTKTKLEQK